MKKLLSLMALSLMSVSAVAVEPSVQITSYTYVNQERKVAELCGVVNNPSAGANFVQITVDHNSSRPGTYNVVAGSNGKFCTVVISYYGTATARMLQ